LSYTGVWEILRKNEMKYNKKNDHCQVF